MSVEYRYSDGEAAAAERRLRKVSAGKLIAADMIAFQREVIQELRSRVVALAEENARLRKQVIGRGKKESGG